MMMLLLLLLLLLMPLLERLERLGLPPSRPPVNSGCWYHRKPRTQLTRQPGIPLCPVNLYILGSQVNLYIRGEGGIQLLNHPGYPPFTLKVCRFCTTFTLYSQASALSCVHATHRHR